MQQPIICGTQKCNVIKQSIQKPLETVKVSIVRQCIDKKQKKIQRPLITQWFIS